MKIPWKSFVVIVVLGILVFANRLNNNFLGDDNQQIVDNPIVHSISNIGTFFQGGTFYNGTSRLSGAYFKPLNQIYYSLLFTFFGANQVAFHATQLLLHILNTCILFLLFAHFFKKPLALGLSFIFLVHPINSESVFYISAAQEVLFFLFGISGLYLLTKTNKQNNVIIISLLLFTSLLAKETSLLFLLVVTLYAFLFKHKQRIAILIGSLIAGGMYLLLRVNAIGLFVNPNLSPINKLTLWQRFANMPLIFFQYIKTFLFPLQLSSSYRFAYPIIDATHFFLPLAIDIVFIGLLIFGGIIIYKKSSKKYFRQYLFFGAWFLAGIVILLQIIPLDVTLAERWFYFPIVGVLGMLGTFLTAVNINLHTRKILFIYAIILLFLSLRTHQRSSNWRDYFTLASHDISVTPEAYDLEDVIGMTYLQQGDVTRARKHMQRSIQIYPTFQSYNNLGLLYFKEEKYQQAQAAFIQALSLGEHYSVYENLALIRLVLEDHENNIRFIHEALNKLPQDAKLWMILAIAEYQLEHFESAEQAISTAYRYDPNPLVTYYHDAILRREALDVQFQIAQ